MITVAEHQVINYHEREPAEARLLASRTWTNEDGQTILGGSDVNSPDFYKSVGASLVDDVVTIEPFEDVSPTVVDAVFNGVTYTLALYDEDGGYIVTVYDNLKVSDLNDPTTWATIDEYSRTRRIPYSVTVPTWERIYPIINNLQTAPDATTVIKGKGKHSATGTDTFVSDTDLRVVDNLVNYGGDVDLAISEIGSNERVLRINAQVDLTSKAFPSNITLEFGSRGKLNFTGNGTVNVASMANPGNRKVFFGTNSNRKVIFGKNAVPEINLSWWVGQTSGADITHALNQALESVNTHQGVIYIPIGEWLSSGGHVISDGVTIKGTGNTPFAALASAIKLSSPSTSYLFKIGESTYSVRFENLTLDGTGTTNKDGILLEGTAPATSADLHLKNVTIAAFKYGLRHNSLGGTWQFAQVYLDTCIFQSNTHSGLNTNSVNSNFTLVNTNFQIPANAYGIYTMGIGALTTHNTEYGGAGPGQNSTCIYVGGSHAPINLHGGQSENCQTVLETNGDDNQSIINFWGTNLQGVVQMNGTRNANSYGSNWLSYSFQDAPGVLSIVTSRGDNLRPFSANDGTTPVDPVRLDDFTGGSIVVVEESGISSMIHQRVPVKNISPINFDEDVFEDTPLFSVGYRTNVSRIRPLIAWGVLNPSDPEELQHYYWIERNTSTGWTHFKGSQSYPFKGYAFDSAISVPFHAYDATEWNDSPEVATKGDIRDKLEAMLLASGLSAATTTETLTGTNTTKGVTPDALAALWEKGSDIASAGTISVGEGGFFNITGTTGITDIDFAVDKAGRTVWLKFAGALTLTHSSTLILPTSANITTAAGDTACFVSEGSDVVRCLAYQRADGTALVSAGGGLSGLGSNDNKIVRTDGTGGTAAQGSAATLDDSGNLDTTGRIRATKTFSLTDYTDIEFGNLDEDGNFILKHNNGKAVKIRDNAGQVNLQVDSNNTAGNTRFLIYDVDNGTLERVSVGAADSAGSGFKVLRIPN